MSAFDLYVLNAGTQVLPIDNVAPHIKARLNIEHVESVLSRKGSRGGSITLDKFAAKMVDIFKRPSSLPATLKALSEHFGVEAEVLLESAYPFLQKLVQMEYLVKSETEHGSPNLNGNGELAAGEFFQDYKIISRAQQLDDSVVYKAITADGRAVALKILLRPDSIVREAFKREAIILNHLNGAMAPALVAANFSDRDTDLAMEWIDGPNPVEWAARVRNMPHQERYQELKRLIIELFSTYRDLHQQGVFHGDVWFKNLLLEKSGRLRVIDFGFGWFPQANDTVGIPVRAVNAYFRPPEVAYAELNSKATPNPDAASEFYAIGAILYLMITGRQYLHFSIGQNTQLREIIEKPMLCFAEVGADSWPEMEMLLRELLAKEPAQRPRDLSDCIERVRNMSIPALGEIANEETPTKDRIPFIRSFVGEKLDRPLPAPSASIAYGIGGLSYAFTRLSLALDDRRFIPEADYTAACARRWMNEGPDGSFEPQLDLTEEVLGPYAIHYRSQGIGLVEALAAHLQGDVRGLQEACLSFLSGVHREDAELEFTTGKAGLLNALEQLSYLVRENTPLINAGNELASDMLTELRSVRSLSDHSVGFFGFAHGWAGILYSLLSWGKTYGPHLLPEILPLLQKLAAERVSATLGSYWPKHRDVPIEEGDSASWCNGTAGFVLLWTEAFSATGNREFLSLAKEAGLVTAFHQNQDYNVCCGLAGRAFAL